MDKIIIKILPDIDHALKGVTKNIGEQNELRQDLIIKIYENQSKFKKAYNEGNVKGWLFMVARNMYRLSKRSYQTSTVRLNQDITEEDTTEYLPNIKTMDEMLKGLSEMERLWIKTWVDCDFNYSKLQRVTNLPGIQKGIARRHAKIRIDQILEKWKHLDIYLEQ